MPEVTTQLDAIAHREGLEIDDIVRLLSIAYGGPGWREDMPRTVAYLDRDVGLTKLRGGVASRRRKWSEEAHESLVTACKCLPAVAELTSADRLANIIEPELQHMARNFDLTLGGILSGPTGIGKTMAMVELLSRCMRESHIAKREAAFMKSDDRAPAYDVHAFDPEHRSWSERIAQASEIGNSVEYGQVKTSVSMTSWVHATWLGIDDLGWETKLGRIATQHVLEARYNRGLPTLVTTGMSLSTLRNEYGDAIVRRIVECRGRKGIIFSRGEEAAA